MLAHWNLQSRIIRSAQQRRFLGCVGERNETVQARVGWLAGPPQSLYVQLTGARPIDLARGDVRSPPIDGVLPVGVAVALNPPLPGPFPATLQVNDVSPQQLLAAGFLEPQCTGGEFTGQLVSVSIPAVRDGAEFPVRLGQYFSVDGSASPGSQYILFLPEPLVPCSVGSLSVLDVRAAIQRRDAAAAPAQPPVPGPPAANAQPHVHWAANVAGAQAPAPPPGPAAVPLGAAAAAGAAPVPIGVAVGAAAPPAWRGAQPTPFMDLLFASLTTADLADLASLDTLCALLSPGGTAPLHALLPASDPMARFEYIEEQLSSFCANVPLPPRLQPGWPGVWPCARILARANPPDANPPAVSRGGAHGSFGQLADRHRSAQRSAEPSAPAASGAALAEPAFANAVLQAGVAIDVEGSQPVSNQPLLSAVQGANGILMDSSVASVRALGDAMANLPANLLVLEAADGSNFFASSSAHMAHVHSTLSAVSTRWVASAAESLRAKVACESASTLSRERQLDLERCVRDLFRGNPMRLSEARMAGSGQNSLLGALRSATDGSDPLVDRALTILGWAAFAVDLFRGSTILPNFFTAAADRAAAMIRIEAAEPVVVADWLEHRMRAIGEDFRQFYSNSSAVLIRPSYSALYLTDANASAALAEITQQRFYKLGREMQSFITQQSAAALLAGSAAGSAAVAASPPAGGSAKGKRRKRKAQAAGSSAAAPSPAPAAAAVAAPAAPAAAGAAVVPATAAVNPVPPVAPHVGHATPAQMQQFTAENVDGDGRGRCFNFFRRGVCRRGDACSFSHV